MSAIRIALVTLVAVFAACEVPSTPDTEVTPNLAVGAAENLIRGSGQMTIDGELRNFTFTASGSMDGSATGQFELHARQADARIHGEIVCATVIANIAWIGGTITTAGPYQGQDAIWRVADLGAGQKGWPDIISLLQPQPPGSARPFCDSAPWFPPLLYQVDGNITISSPGQSGFTAVDRFEFVDFPVWVPCAAGGAGELVRLDGSIQFLFHVTEDPAGGFHVGFENNPQGLSGYGETTGLQYQGTGSTGSHTNGSFSSFPITDTFVNNFRIVGQGPGNDLHVHSNVHFTVNANGDLTTVVDNFSFDCR